MAWWCGTTILHVPFKVRVFPAELVLTVLVFPAEIIYKGRKAGRQEGKKEEMKKGRKGGCNESKKDVYNGRKKEGYNGRKEGRKVITIKEGRKEGRKVLTFLTETIVTCTIFKGGLRQRRPLSPSRMPIQVSY